eukprot:TRINITY_DN15467_c0_g1_i1.p1 TRINITY_DN15467_c0_g1~~TRINITY_DN15467_c0_g1_i1.p1  ORF type:complete len:968 (+),score=232.89 TRINITY_DN15467_c0_g1_i1:169-3072(+)
MADYGEDTNNPYFIHKPHLRDVDHVFQLTRSTPQGLSPSEAKSRLQRVGANRLPLPPKPSKLMKFLTQFTEPLVILLLVSCVISIILAEFADAIGIFIAICIVNTVGFVQQQRSEREVESLKSYITQFSLVIRNGIQEKVVSTDLVPGDVVVLNVGDRVPADLRIIEMVDFSVQQDNLNGEMKNMYKTSDTMEGDGNEFPAQRTNMVFMGSMVTNGSANGVVVGTGANTEFGRDFSEMKSDDNSTPLQESMDQLAKQLSVIAFAVVAIIFVAGAIQGKDLLDMFTIAVSLAVAAIPEGLPIVVTVTLALGVTRMAKKRAIIRVLPAVETLGSTTVICSDKTGTLTQNVMTVRELFTTETYSITGTGHYNSTEAKFFRGPHVVDVSNDRHIKELIKVGMLCNNATLSYDSMVTEGKVKALGQSTEVALLVVGHKAGFPTDYRSQFTRTTEIAFKPENRTMSTLYDMSSDQFSSNEGSSTGSSSKNEVWFVKGAVEKILEQSTTTISDQGDIIDLTRDRKGMITEAAKGMGERALRVLAFAYGTHTNHLTFVGLMGLWDPPRDGVRAAIQKVQSAGIEVVMVTGDSKETASAMAAELGILPIDRLKTLNKLNSGTMSGRKMERYNHDDLLDEIHRRNGINVFYRVEPKSKKKLVKALQKRGEIVAMTGDGPNDTVALAEADIGVAMGTGADIAKEVSKMILSDDNFTTIVSAIEEGKSIYQNIMNFLRFQLTTSLATLCIITVSTVFGYPLPFNPIQILWINVIMDGPPAQSLGVEPFNADIMKPVKINNNNNSNLSLPYHRNDVRVVRERKKQIITKRLMTSVALGSVTMVLGTLGIYNHYLGGVNATDVLTAENGGQNLNENDEVTLKASTIGFTTFVLFQLVNALNCRSEIKSVWQVGVGGNKFFWYAVGVCFGLQVMAVYWSVLQGFFITVGISFEDWLVCGAVASSQLVVEEVRKFVLRRQLRE